jgi:hypothetical protein
MAHEHVEEENWHLLSFVEDCNSGEEQLYNPHVHRRHHYPPILGDLPPSCMVCFQDHNNATYRSFRGTLVAGVVRTGKVCPDCLNHLANDDNVEEVQLQCFSCGTFTNNHAVCFDCEHRLDEEDRREDEARMEDFWREMKFGPD